MFRFSAKSGLSLVIALLLGAALYLPFGRVEKKPTPTTAAALTQETPRHTADATAPASASAAQPASADTPPGNPGGAKPLWQPGAPIAATNASQPSAPAVTIDIRAALDALPHLRQGDRIEIPLTNGARTSGRVNLIQRDPSGILRVAGGLDQTIGGTTDTGSFSLTLAGDQLSGRILLPTTSRAYVVESSADGQTRLTETPLSSILCDPFPQPAAEKEKSSAQEDVSAQSAAGDQPQAAPPILSSRPTATAVLYLDFDGATVTDPDWNNGKTIVASASYLADYEITQVWQRVSEDYAPFDIDVTTSAARYDAAPTGKRMRCIITPTDEWYDGDAGGVAYTNSFARAGSSFSPTIPCWVFNYSVGAIAEAVSHEFGHTLGLSHDGTTSPAEEYYEGHGSGLSSWGAIMGTSYDRIIVQWSKGEYASANNKQDDVAIIAGNANGFGYVADEAADTRANATGLTLSGNTFSQAGAISSASDADWYRFTVTDLSINLRVDPAELSPNLDLTLELYDSTGQLLQRVDPDASLAASLNRNLPAGTYFVKLQGTGRGDPLNTGYSSYGSIGRYSLAATFGPTATAPGISIPPASATVTANPNGSFGLSVTASGQGTLTYQWKKDGVDLMDNGHFYGAATSALSVSSPTAADAGQYSVVVTNFVGSTTSTAAAITIVAPPPPIFTSQPQSGTLYAGEYYSTYPSVSSIGTTTFQWYKDDAPFVPSSRSSSGTSTYFSIANLTSEDAGRYQLLATNASGSTWSAVAVLTISLPPPPHVVVNPTDITAYVGNASANLHADGNSIGFITYQWEKEGEPLPADGSHFSGVNSSLLTILLPAAADSGHYRLKISNAGGSTYTHEATLTVTDPPLPTIAAQPQSRSAYLGDFVATFQVQMADTLSAYTYQWQKDGVNLTADSRVVFNRAGLTLYNPTAADAGNYRVIVTNVSGSATSDAALFTVTPPPPPVVVGNPTGRTVTETQGFELYAGFNSPTPITVQWYKDGVLIPYATNSSLSKSNVTSADAGVYKASATNLGGTTFTTEATIVVAAAAPPVIVSQPVDVRVYEGAYATLSPRVESDPAATYSWEKDGVPYSSGTYSATLYFPVATPADAGSYTLTATNVAGSVTSQAAKVTVLSRTSGEALDVTPLLKIVGPDRVTYSVRVRSASDWSVENTASWVAVSKTTGRYDDTLDITVAPNPHDTPRTASLRIAGISHVLSQRPSGSPVRELWGLGENRDGLLGDNAVLATAYPQFLDAGVQDACSTNEFALLLKKDGTLSSTGNLAIGSEQGLPGGSIPDVQATACGDSHVVYLKTDATVWGIGRNDARQLKEDGSVWLVTAPIQLASNVKAIAAAGSHTLYITTDGRLWARGSNAHGQIGAGDTTSVATATEIATGVVAVDTRYDATIFLKNDGSVWAMGASGDGRFGGTIHTVNQRTPVQIATGATAISLGSENLLFLKADHTLWGLGRNSAGQLGSVSMYPSDAVLISNDVESMTAGDRCTFFLKTDGALWALGSNNNNQLGIGITSANSPLVKIRDGVKRVISRFDITFFLHDDDSAWVVGATSRLMTGLGYSEGRKRTTPIQIASDVIAADIGNTHSLFVTNDHRLWGMGSNSGYVMGIASANFPSSTPVPLATGVDAVSAGGAFSLIRQTDSSLWSLGPLHPRNDPSAAKVADNVSAFDAGHNFIAFLKSDATLWSQGANYAGQLGQSTTTQSNPAAGQIATGIVAAATGDDYTLFLDSAGNASATGANGSGQFGDGTTNGRTAPSSFASGVAAISAGQSHALWIKTDHTLWGAGNNTAGQLGSSTLEASHPTPIQIASDASFAAAGDATTYYVTSDKILWGLGANGSGQLGDGSTTSRSSPVKIAAHVESVSAAGAHLLFIASGDIRLDTKPPTITAFSPATGSPGQSITITGTNFTGVTEVLFNGIASPSVTVATGSTTELTAVIPDDPSLATGPLTVATFDGIATTAASFTPAWSPRIYSQPANQTVTNGLDISFAADAGGSPAVTHQWQVSTDSGATWSNVTDGGVYSGATSAKLSLVGATSSMNGNRYRYAATNSLGTITSDAFSLAVAPIQFPRPTSLAFDPSGNLYVADGALHTIQKINTSAQVSVLAGTAQASGSADGTGSAARFNEPKGLTFGGSSVYVSDTSNSLIRTITASGTVATLAGSKDNRTHQDGTGANAWFAAPLGLARDASGNLFVADSASHTIRKITPAGVVTTIAGSPGVSGSTDGSGSAARFNEPSDLAFGSDGNLYVADALNHTIRRIALGSSAIVTTFAGLPETPGDFDGQGFDASFRTPRGLVADAAGNLYVADTGNSCIRKVTLTGSSAGTVTTIAGDSMLEGYRNGSGFGAWFRQPSDVAIDASGNLIVADTGNSALRKIVLDSGAVTTLIVTEAVTENPDPGTGGNTGGGTGGGTTPAPSSGGGGGGGGGGAPSLGYFAALAALLALRRASRPRR